MRTLKLYNKELRFMQKHGKTVIRRPEWNIRRNFYGVPGDFVKITDRAESGFLVGKIKNRKHDKRKTCWVMLLEVFA